MIPVGSPDASWTTAQLLRGVTSWANSVRVVSHDRQLGRPTWSDDWLEDVGVRLGLAVDLLRGRV